MSSAQVPPPVEILFGGGVALASSLEGEIRADELHGLFAGDTRVLSTLRITIAGQGWRPLARLRTGRGAAEWTFQNRQFRAATGPVEEGSLTLELRRRVAGSMHDDIRIRSYSPSLVRFSLIVQLDADFADLFEVKARAIPPRLQVQRMVRPDGLDLRYRHGRFERALKVSIADPSTPPRFSGASIFFDVELNHGDDWRCCVHAEPSLGGVPVPFIGDPHVEEPQPDEDPTAPTIICEAVLRRPFQVGQSDLSALEMTDGSGNRFVAAGVPWFLTLFGRDTLVVSLMTGLIGAGQAEGALEVLGELQADAFDDQRDAEPGKLPHELRRGELAHLGSIPHTPYYGTHDAPALYCLALWNAWRWTGDRGLMDRHMETVMRGLQWCDALGDRDGDGLQEYATRSDRGYYNQSWKDAEDAIVHEDGRLAPLPIATIELQGYLYAARLAAAELLDASGEAGEAVRQRRLANELRALVEDRFWMPEEAFYSLALDGNKRRVTSISSNPGQLLWSGLPMTARAHAVTERLFKEDLFSGWGIRTLSSSHPAYNPLSYQLGSVWPHDTLAAAAGMCRYGLQNEAHTLIRSILEAASCFEGDRLPELFCGFDRSEGPPVPYVEANVPQAWAAAVPILATQLFLGVIPDAPRGRCLISPSLPEWLPRLGIRDLSVGEGSLDLVIARAGDAVVIEEMHAREIDVERGYEEAPLWGRVGG
jgi:glycogen debranching enzyme